MHYSPCVHEITLIQALYKLEMSMNKDFIQHTTQLLSNETF